MPKHKKHKDHRPIINVLRNNNDKYGTEYKKTLEPHVNAFPCFCCNVLLSQYLGECPKCKYTYYFCKKCQNDMSVICLMTGCIFCTRLLNDNIIKLLTKTSLAPSITYDLKDDLYGQNLLTSIVDGALKN